MISRPGVTLLELIFVIGVIALIAALFLPAINAAREAARRIKCQNQLRQLALAAANYESTHGVLPPAFTQTGHSSFAFLLPYLEQTAIYNMCDFEDTTYGMDSGNEAAMRTPLPILHCPSVVSSNSVRADYLMNKGNNTSATTSPWFYPYPGLTHLSLGNLKNGASNTILFSEFGLCDGEVSENYRSLPRKPFNGSSDEQVFIEDCRQSGGNRIDTTYRPGRLWLEGGTCNFHTILTPNSNTCLNGDRSSGILAQSSVYTSRSLHRGGVQSAFGDGHVQFVSSGIDRLTWQGWGDAR